jgi:phosphatidate cytidylyltransferase
MLALWTSPLYQETVMVVLATLFSLGLLIFFMRKKSVSTEAAWASVQSWLFAAPVLLLVLGLPSPWTVTVLTLIAMAGAKTFFQLTGMYHRSYFVWACYAGMVGLAITSYSERVDLFNLMPMAVLGLICLIPIWLNSSKQMIQYMSLTFIAFTLLGWAFMHIGLLMRWEHGPFLVIYIVLLTEVCDNIYLAASRLGKIRLFSRIHSRRTLEGFLIAWACTMVLAWALRNLLHNQHEIYWVTSGVVAAFAGSLGDMVLSVIRRDLGIKDVGAFILGRGDLITRMDRMIFVAPIFYYALVLLERYAP